MFYFYEQGFVFFFEGDEDQDSGSNNVVGYI